MSSGVKPAWASEQHGLPGQRRGEQRATRQRDAVLVVRRRPLGPHGAGRVAEHRATVELLAVAEDGPEFHGGTVSSDDSILAPRIGKLE
jgi:hypothetical protein